jgi:hypothetical protein
MKVNVNLFHISRARVLGQKSEGLRVRLLGVALAQHVGGPGSNP